MEGTVSDTVRKTLRVAGIGGIDCTEYHWHLPRERILDMLWIHSSYASTVIQSLARCAVQGFDEPDLRSKSLHIINVTGWFLASLMAMSALFLTWGLLLAAQELVDTISACESDAMVRGCQILRPLRPLLSLQILEDVLPPGSWFQTDSSNLSRYGQQRSQ